MIVMVVLLVLCQIVFCDSLRLKELLQLNISNSFILWCSFVIRYVLIWCQEIKEISNQQWLLHNIIGEVIAVRHIMCHKSTHKEVVWLRRITYWKVTWRLAFPNTWWTCQMWCLLQTSSLSETQDCYKSVYIFESFLQKYLEKSNRKNGKHKLSAEQKKKLLFVTKMYIVYFTGAIMCSRCLNVWLWEAKYVLEQVLYWCSGWLQMCCEEEKAKVLLALRSVQVLLD